MVARSLGLYGHSLLVSYSLCLMSQAHPLQLEAFSLAIRRLDADMPRPILQFVGSCRNKFDEDRLQKLQDKAVELNVDGDVQFYKNVMYRLVQAFYNLDPYCSHFLLLKAEELDICVHMCVYVYVGKRARAHTHHLTVSVLYFCNFFLKKEKPLEGCDVEHAFHMWKKMINLFWFSLLINLIFILLAHW